ncbi:hypothetical protein DID88_009072 [Monilinia fructigena]|uniref:Protein kinase domain-containing protein n=1 Tax=Monilinia fructigena TaxID=38457 RepID=A0A395IGJ0_9HELO|nr:hypothetical protein DID88_009072 [Monilinia fructigena]
MRPVNQALSRLGGDGANDCNTSTSSPLKRSDTMVNLDQASLGSPVAKRRSLHVVTSENTASPFTSTPRRSSSLRKSTLLQRNGEKTSWGRRHAAQLLAAQQSAQQQPFAIASHQEIVSPSKQKNRPRLSLDQFVAPMGRDTPFNHQGSLPNASMHMTDPSFVRYSIDTFNPHGAPAIGTFGKGNGVFGSSFGQPRGLTRRGSFLSIDGDDLGSPDFKTDSQISDFDLPPTPTKQAASFSHFQNSSPTSHRSIPVSVSAVGGYSLGKIPRSSTSPLERVDFIERLSPCTPQDSMLPPDPSGLSISNHRDGHAQLGANTAPAAPPPATPTTGRDYFGKTSTTPVGSFPPRDVDESLVSRFDQVEMIGTGEFSEVYRVTQSSQKASAFLFGDSVDSPMTGRTPPTPMPPRIYAVKKSKQPYQGFKDRSRKLKEVETEFCEEGSLDIFLYQVGRKGRVDDFRIWKILLEIGQGLQHIHDSGFIHLDIKPANIMITFEGVLKIGDFGDREYIGPEILLGQYDKPADVFALGMVIFEIATNVYLPDNGISWQRLRSGDMSEAPSLTWSEASSMLRDANGIPIVPSDDSMTSDDEFDADFGSPIATGRKRFTSSSKSFAHDPSNLFGSSRRGELDQAPEFMRDPNHECTLDKLVRWMISPRPQDRPLIHEVLESEGLQWVGNRRRAGATVFEGNWGPANEILADDAEMMDV